MHTRLRLLALLSFLPAALGCSEEPSSAGATATADDASAGVGGGASSSTNTSTGGASSSGMGGAGATTSASGTGGAVVPGDVLFFDDFEYIADRAPASGDAFVTEGGWTGFKDMRTSQNAGGYLYTVDGFPGFDGAFPGAASNRVLAIESRVGTEAPQPEPGWSQTDFYLQYGDEGGGAIGDVPPDLWIQFWMYQNDFGEQASQYSRSDKWIYPTRTFYPATEGTLDWLFLLGSASLEPSNLELGSGPDRFAKLIGTGADFTAATEYPTNASKLGPNLDTDNFLARNVWTLVKIHIDTSGEQGTYEVWLRAAGGESTKVAEWIGGVTPSFSWPIPAEHRAGHKMFRIPTTMNMTASSGGGDSWTYLDDFALATSEAALPQYP